MIVEMLGPEGQGVYQIEWTAGNQPVGPRISRQAEAILVPGFVDIHIHGAFGIDFIDDPIGLPVLKEKLARDGYEAFLPTTVTTSAENVAKALSVLPAGDPMIPGFHLEGPFISDKFPGAQPASFIADIDEPAWNGILADPRLKVITMAPEIPHALGLIDKLSQRGVRVSMGHSDATFDEARRGFEFGARHTTHTFNAMRGFHHREAGLAGYALSSDDLYCELIYDRIHVSRDSAALLFKCKGPHRVIAVSDSTAASGLPPGTHMTMWGQQVVVGRGDVRMAEGSALAGSAITLLDAFRNLAEDFGLETATRACSINPRRAIGMTDPPRTWVRMDRNFKVEGVYHAKTA